jgi:hypothetical protein
MSGPFVQTQSIPLRSARTERFSDQPTGQHAFVVQQATPLQQADVQHPACLAAPERRSLTFWTEAVLALPAWQQPAAQHANLQQFVLHLEVPQHLADGLAKADEPISERASARPATIVLFISNSYLLGSGADDELS